MEIRFDNFAALQAFAGNDFGPWGPELAITQRMIDEFAALTGDRQWIHVDVARAQREGPFAGTAFSGTVAHGFLTLSLLPQLDPRDLIVSGYSSVANYGARGLRFLAPVPAGSHIHARSRLLDAVPHSKGSLLTFASEVYIVGQPTPVLIYEAQVLYLR